MPFPRNEVAAAAAAAATVPEPLLYPIIFAPKSVPGESPNPSAISIPPPRDESETVPLGVSPEKHKESW